MKSLMAGPQSCWKGRFAASSKPARRERDQAQPQMPTKVAKEATVAISRRMLMSISFLLLQRAAQGLQVRDQRVLLGLALEFLGRLPDVFVGVRDARDAQ